VAKITNVQSQRLL